MSVKTRAPGLAKTRRLPLLRQRALELWEAADYRWRELFQSADVMSEGAVRREAGEADYYYGLTSVMLRAASRDGPIPDRELERVAMALNHDPHARVRALRIAYLEAQLRAEAPVLRMLAEVVVRRTATEIRVDVEARLASSRTHAGVDASSARSRPFSRSR